MQDVQNYQYYDPSPRPDTEPWWRRKRTWQVLGLVALGVVVLLFAVLAAGNVLKNRKLAKQDADAILQADQMTSQLGSDCNPTDAACLERARSDAARALGVVQACDQLTGESLATCVTLIANDRRDAEICKQLSGADQEDCQNSTYLLQALAESNAAVCDKMSAGSTQGACYAQVRATAVASGNCAAAGVDQTVCDSAKTVAEAIKSGDPMVCAALVSEDERYDCEQGIWSVDEDEDNLVLADEFSRGLSDSIPDGDSDGLLDGDEVNLYLTNPAKADTDNDGYADGIEVSGGYDPLK